MKTTLSPEPSKTLGEFQSQSGLAQRDLNQQPRVRKALMGIWSYRYHLAALGALVLIVLAGITKFPPTVEISLNPQKIISSGHFACVRPTQDVVEI